MQKRILFKIHHSLTLLTLKRLLLAISMGCFMATANATPMGDATAAYEKGDYTQALKILEPLAAKGDAQAQYNIGVIYYEGRGGIQDSKEALKWYKLSAAQGNASAQNHLDLMYENGQRVTHEPAKGTIEQVNSYLVVSCLLLLGLNVITVLILLRVLAWRKTVANGMMAIVPSEVIGSLEIVSQNQSKFFQWLQSEISVITKALSEQVQSITILKKELEAKDVDLAYFRAGALSVEKNKMISKLIKLHSFLKTLEEQVLAGGVKHEVAIGFLKDELADLFVEFNITEISPAPLTPLKDLPLEGYSVREVVQVNDASLNQTVAELLESGYYLNFAGSKGKVIRSATLKINKFGE